MGCGANVINKKLSERQLNFKPEESGIKTRAFCLINGLCFIVSAKGSETLHSERVPRFVPISHTALHPSEALQMCHLPFPSPQMTVNFVSTVNYSTETGESRGFCFEITAHCIFCHVHEAVEA